MELLKKKYEYKQNLIGTDYQQLPLDSRKVRVNCIGEIVKAKNFTESDNLYIKWEFLLPNWFTLDYEEIIELFHNDDKRMEEMIEDWNKTESVTHSVKPKFQMNKDGTPEMVANFCFPFDLQLLVDQDYIEFNKSYPSKISHDIKAMEEEKKFIKHPKFPVLLLELNSVDNWGRSKVEGYGFCHIPREPGFHEVEIQTWAPEVSLSQKIYSFFLGGQTKVKDIKKIAESSFMTEDNIEARLNRYNISTVSKGSVSVRFNVAFQSSTGKQITSRFQYSKIHE